MLVQRGRLALSLAVDGWLAVVAMIQAVRLLPLEPAVAMAATRLPEPFHADPADLFLVAQSRELAVPQLGADRKIRDYPHGQSLWCGLRPVRNKPSGFSFLGELPICCSKSVCRWRRA
jgi:PIN domain nuclease of toxin-antitoxin system